MKFCHSRIYDKHTRKAFVIHFLSLRLIDVCKTLKAKVDKLYMFGRIPKNNLMSVLAYQTDHIMRLMNTLLY